MGLQAVLESLESELRDAEASDRPLLEAQLAWCHAERGELGEAFRRLWEAAPAESAAPSHLLTRAELQAYCGNEDAALALTAGLGEQAGASLVRARVAASRGDWELASRCANEAAERGAVPRALLLSARASIELDRAEEAEGLLARVEPQTLVDSLQMDALRARLDRSDPEAALREAAERAREAAAVRTQAETWSWIAKRCSAKGDRTKMRNASLRALELWDEMATSLPPPLRAGFWSDAERRAIRNASMRAKDEPIGVGTAALAPLLANLRHLASERDLTTLLKVITDGAVALSGAERGFVLLVDERGAVEAKTIRGARNELGEPTAAFSRSIAETVLIDGDPVVTVDAAHDVRVQDYMSVHQLMLKSVACLPIESRGRVWGVLYLEHRSASGRFAGTDLSLLRAYADQAAIAIETSHLFDRIESQKEALERANAALREANEHLGQRLHGQTEALERSRREIASLQGSVASGERWGLVGSSEGMRAVYEVLDRVAVNEVPVVVTGESGTGKELVARAIHRASARTDAPFVSLNCGAIPEGLLESELFGHVAGAFTGAARAREGVFQQAHGGTLFLDEISDMPARMQLDLLRVLQERCVRPVGSADERTVDVRLITASKEPPRRLVDEGTLREDLYYRLAVVELPLPPLRERRSDIPQLAEHFLTRIAAERGEPKKRLSRAAVERLCAHDFPGNVRELEHLLINAMVFASGETIDANELAIEDADRPTRPSIEAHNYSDFKDAERERILSMLNAHGWNRARAARALGMPRRTFYRRLKEHGIELPKGGR